MDLLVPVMKRLSTWTRPVVMIPGNHDQVTLGGRVHALTPLKFAFADPKQVRLGGGSLRRDLVVVDLRADWLPRTAIVIGLLRFLRGRG